MPTYVYACKCCQHEFEISQKMTDEALTECPECKGKIARVLFPPGIVFKGSGFHINDYPSSKSAASGKPSKPETPAETKAETKTESKSESKPETKSDTKTEAVTAKS